MYREITTVNAPVYQLPIPKELRGKKIKIIAYAIEDLETNENKTSFAERTKNLTFNNGGYKFNRNEANDYE